MSWYWHHASPHPFWMWPRKHFLMPSLNSTGRVRTPHQKLWEMAHFLGICLWPIACINLLSTSVPSSLAASSAERGAVGPKEVLYCLFPSGFEGYPLGPWDHSISGLLFFWDLMECLVTVPILVAVTGVGWVSGGCGVRLASVPTHFWSSPLSSELLSSEAWQEE